MWFSFFSRPWLFWVVFRFVFLLFSFSVLAALLGKRRNFIGKSAKRGYGGNLFYDFIIASSANTKGFELHRSPKITTQPRFYRNHPLNEVYVQFTFIPFLHTLYGLFWVLFGRLFGPLAFRKGCRAY